MSTIADKIKVLLEIDDLDNIYDNQLALTIDSGLQFLRNNNIPLDNVDAASEEMPDLENGDENIVIDWLRWYCLERLDRALAATAGETALKAFIHSEKTNFLFMLKARYDKSTRPKS